MKPIDSKILTINGGSSSIKFALYQVGEPLKRKLYGKIDRIGLSGKNLTFTSKRLQTVANLSFAPFQFFPSTFLWTNSNNNVDCAWNLLVVCWFLG